MIGVGDVGCSMVDGRCSFRELSHIDSNKLKSLPVTEGFNIAFKSLL
jgi:hypothetical protein